MREDGLRIDRLLLTTDTTYLPAGFGLAETARQAAGAPGLLTNLDRVIEYDYDRLYHLTNAAYSSGESYQYDYDPVGNRLQQIINGDTTDYLYDAANRLEQVDGQSYTLDANGNLLQTGTMTNTWDAANRLIETTRQTDQTTNRLTPIYNGVGDRVGQTVGLTTTTFALDAVGGLPEVIYTSEGNTYLHLPGVIMAESSEGEVRYLLSDGLGSVRQATDEAGAVVAYHEFDPYGNPVDNEGGEPYGYTGEWWEQDVQLLHLRARWYAPGEGIFLSRDAVESEPGYQYVRGNPINWVDPYGQDPCSSNNPTEICYSQPGVGTITTNPISPGSGDSTGINVSGSIDQYLKVVYAIQSSHTLQKDDGIIFGISGGISSLLTQAGMNSPQSLNTFLVAFDDVCLSATGKTGGLEVVFDFKHQERGTFGYKGNLLNIGTIANGGGAAYIGKTRGFMNADYDQGVDAYSGPFASITLNLGHKSLPFGGVFIEAAPLFASTNNINPGGVFATYYGLGGGLGVGSPINGDIAVTNYTLLQRQRYVLGVDYLFVDNPWASWLGIGITEDDIINLKQKDVTHRKAVAALMTSEIIRV